jgi:hypothetical protein
MRTQKDQLLALALTVMMVSVVCYAIAADRNSDLLPRSFKLQALIFYALLAMSMVTAVASACLVGIRRVWMYLIPLAGSIVAVFRVILLVS